MPKKTESVVSLETFLRLPRPLTVENQPVAEEAHRACYLFIEQLVLANVLELADPDFIHDLAHDLYLILEEKSQDGSIPERVDTRYLRLLCLKLVEVYGAEIAPAPVVPELETIDFAAEDRWLDTFFAEWLVAGVSFTENEKIALEAWLQGAKGPEIAKILEREETTYS